MSTAIAVATVVVLLAIKVGALISAKSSRFDNLPRPTQID